MLGFLPTRAYRPGTPGATTFLSPLSGTFNYGWDSFVYDEGIARTLEDVIALERALGVGFALVQTYWAWGDEGDPAFPERILDAVHDLGSIPVITWEPWLTTFESRLHPELPLRNVRDRNGLASIARGRLRLLRRRLGPRGGAFREAASGALRP